ncbi:aldo/keto reductase [Priestia megaterium]|uniref:aldo/keto reductase n=1 Tax=Priestia megaterium TaxID=1404 RepID=UPI0020792912|nr:aldo/keto reductase [Priestia megaterium]USL39546.1 aldo/keto reductase [Priestia megaterium]
MEFVKLNNGVKMPMVGLGVFRVNDHKECEEMVYQAIEMGYRLIDTAAAYENEEAVGRAIKRSRVPREDLFITTKLWVTDTNYEGAKRGFQRSLDRLGLDYIDLYVIHQPNNDYYGAWRAMEELYQEGKVRAIGVDNFQQDRLVDFINFNRIKPAVNLIEANVFFQREEELSVMKEKNIQMEAWSPLAAGNNDLFSNDLLQQLSIKYKKSVAQIVLRWLFQRGIVSIPKSSNLKRMKENLDIFDFDITKEDMNAIAHLDTNQSCFPTRYKAKEVEEFLEIAKKYKV